MILSNGAILPSQLGSLADTTPLFADASYYPSTYLAMLNQYATYAEIYRKQLWVGVVVRKLAKATARMPFDIKRHGEANSQAPEPGLLADLLRQPNPSLSGYKLWEWTASTRKVYGEAYWLKVRDQNLRVRELRPMHPANIIARRDDDGELYYVYTTGTRNVSQLPPIPSSDVVAFTGYNPDSLERGMSNLEGLNQTLLNEDASRRATASFWNRGARPSVILSTPHQMSPTAQNRLKADWDSNQGGADRMGGTAVLDEGIVPHIVQLNSLEMQYIESRKLNREEVAAAFDMPPSAIGILDHATFSNVTELLRSVYRDTMAPDFVEYESVVNHQLIPDFDKTGDVFSRFNMDEVLRGDFETRATAVSGLLERGVLTPNEARPMFGYAPFPGGDADRLYANAAMVPLGSPAERISVTAAVPATAAQAGELQEVEGTGDAAAAVSPIKALIKALEAFAPRAIAPTVVEADASPRDMSVRQIRARVMRKASKEQRAALVAEHESMLKTFFQKQRAQTVTKAFNPTDWDTELADVLSTLGQATATTIGGKIAKDLGSDYSLNDLQDWLDGNTSDAARTINQTTADAIQKAIDDANELGADPTAPVDAVTDPNEATGNLFDTFLTGRVAQIAATRVAVVGGYSSVDAGTQAGASTKTWTLGGGNPRASHASMSGETVPLGEKFSNDMDYPGDFAGGVDEVAGCTCSLTINKEGSQ